MLVTLIRWLICPQHFGKLISSVPKISLELWYHLLWAVPYESYCVYLKLFWKLFEKCGFFNHVLKYLKENMFQTRVILYPDSTLNIAAPQIWHHNWIFLGLISTSIILMSFILKTHRELENATSLDKPAKCKEREGRRPRRSRLPLWLRRGRVSQ